MITASLAVSLALLIALSVSVVELSDRSKP